MPPGANLPCRIPPRPAVRTPERVLGNRRPLAVADLLAAEAEVIRLDRRGRLLPLGRRISLPPMPRPPKKPHWQTLLSKQPVGRRTAARPAAAHPSAVSVRAHHGAPDAARLLELPPHRR